MIDISKLDVLSKKSFPPCMKHIYDNLKIESHLKVFELQFNWGGKILYLLELR